MMMKVSFAKRRRLLATHSNLLMLALQKDAAGSKKNARIT
jgi:hypothetical protein